LSEITREPWYASSSCSRGNILQTTVQHHSQNADSDAVKTENNSITVGISCTAFSKPVTELASPPQSFPASGSFPMIGSSHHVAKILELHLQSFQGISGLISYRIDWFDVFAAHGTLKSLLQNHNSKPLILQRSAFFMVQLSCLYLTPGKP